MFSSLNAGSSSNGKASSTQYLLMIGATLVSMNARTCFTNRQFFGGQDSASW